MLVVVEDTTNNPQELVAAEPEGNRHNLEPHRDWTLVPLEQVVVSQKRAPIRNWRMTAGSATSRIGSYSWPMYCFRSRRSVPAARRATAQVRPCKESMPTSLLLLLPPGPGHHTANILAREEGPRTGSEAAVAAHKHSQPSMLDSGNQMSNRA